MPQQRHRGYSARQYGIRIGHSSTLGNRKPAVLNLLFRSVAPLAPEISKRIARELRMGTTEDQPVKVIPLPEVAAALANPSIGLLSQLPTTAASGIMLRSPLCR